MSISYIGPNRGGKNIHGKDYLSNFCNFWQVPWRPAVMPRPLKQPWICSQWLPLTQFPSPPLQEPPVTHLSSPSTQPWVSITNHYVIWIHVHLLFLIALIHQVSYFRGYQHWNALIIMELLCLKCCRWDSTSPDKDWRNRKLPHCDSFRRAERCCRREECPFQYERQYFSSIYIWRCPFWCKISN